MGYQTLAAVDLGSNSFKLQVARVQGEQLYLLDGLKEPVRLAAGLDKSKRLDADSQQRALDCLRRFNERLRGLPEGAVRCVGTSALRVAKNADRFLEQAEAALGFPIEIIAGREEARLIYLGVTHSLPPSTGRRLVVDIGGGSTECIIGSGAKQKNRESLLMGCVNFSLRFFPGGKIEKSALKEAELQARLIAQGIEADFSKAHWDEAVGSSGSIRAIADILEAAGWSQGITADGMAQLREVLLKAGHVDRLDVPGLRAERRPVLAGGFAILSGLFAELGIRQMNPATGALREDLYHLLAVFPIHLPPLRERRRDILPLAETLLRRIGSEIGRAHLDLDDEAKRAIEGAPWPGNVRELANVLERAAILASGPRIRAADLQPLNGASPTAPAPATGTPSGAGHTLADLERDAIQRALAATGGNRREAAERLGIGLRTLYDKLKRYRLEEG